MIGLKIGQEVFGKFKVQSKMGPGILYLLNTGIALEVSRNGLALELNYNEITLVKEIKKEMLLVSWAEEKDSYDIKLNAKNAKEIVQKMTGYQNEKLLG